jgi:hypothetical protein
MTKFQFIEAGLDSPRLLCCTHSSSLVKIRFKERNETENDRNIEHINMAAKPGKQAFLLSFKSTQFHRIRHVFRLDDNINLLLMSVMANEDKFLILG